MPEMLPPLPSDAQGRAILLLAPSARADLDDLQCLAARLYLDSLRREGRREPEVILCDPDGAFGADLPARTVGAPCRRYGIPPVPHRAIALASHPGTVDGGKALTRGPRDAPRGEDFAACVEGADEGDDGSRWGGGRARERAGRGESER